MNHYNIDFNKLGTLLLPTGLRRPLISALLVSAIKPIITVYNLFLIARKNDIYTLQHNGQLCILRKLLNESFQTESITIEDGATTGVWQYAYDEAVDAYNNVLMITDRGVEPTVLLWDKNSILESLSSFVVKVPATIQSDDVTNKVRAIVNQYKLLSKSFSIIYYGQS